MSNNKRASKETAGSVGSNNKKQLQQSTLFSDGDEVLEGLNKAHIGTQRLIPAKVLYSGGQVPFGQEVGGPAQKMSFFQMVTNTFLSVLIYSTRCEYDILKVLLKKK